MKTFALFDQDLKKGYFFEISTIDQTDLRIAEVSFNARLSKYTIWFNGSLIHTCKTFKSILNRLNRLDKKFPLYNTSEIQ